MSRPDPDATIAVVPWDDDDVARLRDEQQAELATRYDGVADIEPELPAREMLATLAIAVDGAVVGCAALRDASRYGEGYGELKRMYVRPAFRGRGLSRRALVALEQIATERGLRRLILETGVRQPDAIRLYRSAGYRRIPGYGPYVDAPTSVCYARWLVPDAGTRVLVLVGATDAPAVVEAVADAVADLLRERGAPNLRVVVARAAWDTADREAYELAFDGAEVRVAEVVADGPPLPELAARVLASIGWDQPAGR